MLLWCFAVALMVALVTHYNMSEIFSKDDYTIVKNPGACNMEIIMKEGDQIKKYTPSENESISSRFKKDAVSDLPINSKMEKSFIFLNKT